MSWASLKVILRNVWASRATNNVLVENVSWGTGKIGYNSHRASCARRVSLCEFIFRGGPIEILARASSRPKAARRPCLPSLWYSSQVRWHPGGRSQRPSGGSRPPKKNLANILAANAGKSRHRSRRKLGAWASAGPSSTEGRSKF